MNAMNRSLRSSLLLLLTACAASPGGGGPSGGAPIGGPSERVFGTLAYNEDPVSIRLPETAVVRQTFTVSFETYGDSCIRTGETDVRLEPLRAEIRPYDYDTALGLGCDDALTTHVHRASMRFETAGTAEIVVYGLRDTPQGTTNIMETRTLEVHSAPAE